MSRSVKMTFAYNGSDKNRNYAFSDVSSLATDAAIKTAIQGINTSLAGGTSDGLDTFFRSDDYDGTNGTFKKIVAAQIKDQTVEIIDLGAEEEGE